MTLFRRQGGRIEILWDHITTLPAGEPISQLVSHLEPFSRTALKQELQKAGVAGQPHRQLDTGAVPAEVVKLQEQLGLFPQYEAVRRLHSEIRTAGESPERLAALARGYAHLGSLTESFFSPAHKAFTARALLYAERLLSRTGSTQWALAQRAYVRAFAGLHQLALDDLQAAAEKPVRDESFAIPEWAQIIENFCAYDINDLKKSAQAGPMRPLARYLVMLTVELSGFSEATLTSCADVLEDHPGCYRAIDVLNRLNKLGVSRMAAYQGPRHLAATLLDHVLAVPQVPAGIRQEIEEQRDGGNKDDTAFRGDLIDNLQETSVSATDAHEPSLAVLGQLIEELTFLQATIRLRYERNLLGVNADRTVDYFAPIAARHPYGPYLQQYHSDRRAAGAAMLQLIGRLENIEAQPINDVMHGRINALQPAAWRKQARANYDLGRQHLDGVYRDQLLKFVGRLGIPHNEPIAQRLAEISPAMPMTVRYQLYYDEAARLRRAAEWEKRYHDNPPVLMALADAYLAGKDEAAALRCLERVIEVSRERKPYMRLAQIYQRQGKTAEWEQILKRVLELPSPGLANANVRNTLARHYLQRKEYDKAKEYAEAAARSGSAATMLTAADVYMARKEYKRAEEFMEATSRRYEGLRMRWFYWCHNTGQGDAAAANAFTHDYLESLGSEVSAAQLRHIGFFYLLTDDEAKARQVFQAVFDKGKDPRDAMHVIILADKAGDTEARDELLKQLQGAKISLTRSSSGPTLIVRGRPARHLAPLLQAALAEDNNGGIEIAALEELLKKMPAGYPTNLMCFTGRFLEQHGQQELGLKYLQRVASSPAYTRARTVARHLLRARKLEIDAERDVEVKGKFEGAVKIVPLRDLRPAK